jgi:hypothetical protein
MADSATRDTCAAAESMSGSSVGKGMTIARARPVGVRSTSNVMLAVKRADSTCSKCRRSASAFRNLKTSRPPAFLYLPLDERYRSISIGLTYDDSSAVCYSRPPGSEIALNLVCTDEIADRLRHPPEGHQNQDEQDGDNCDSANRGKNVDQHPGRNCPPNFSWSRPPVALAAIPGSPRAILRPHVSVRADVSTDTRVATQKTSRRSMTGDIHSHPTTGAPPVLHWETEAAAEGPRPAR